jgi:ATP-dependent phosphofructokinase / diphosphate-dependent phosphofructokinase
MKLGVLTGGGDCPGLNAVLRALVRRAVRDHGHEVVGFLDGWNGVVEGRWVPLDVRSTRGILPRGGTVLGTSRSTPSLLDKGLQRGLENTTELGVDCLVVVGGDGTLAAAHEYAELGGAVIGVPKTIDNDVFGTEHTFGFNTAVQIATDLIDRLHTTAESHDRVMVVEVMGRHTGHVALHAGMAGGATVTLIPEQPFDIGIVCERLKRRHERGRYASIVVTAEGATPVPGTLDVAPPTLDVWGRPKVGGIGALLADEIAERTGYETRVTVLGHVQRGGTPTAYDRVLCSRFGVAAADAAHDGHNDHMVALKSDRIELVPLGEVVGREKPVADDLWQAARTFFS